MCTPGADMRWILVFLLGALLGAGCLSSIIPDHTSRSADAGVTLPDDGGVDGGAADGQALWLGGRDLTRAA